MSSCLRFIFALALAAPATLIMANEAAAGPCRLPVVHVYKEEGRLVLACGGKPVHTFAVTFGRSPLSPKRRRGDGRTPEGRYMVCSKARLSSLHAFFNLSYPSRRDADRAVRRGRISAARRDAIGAAHDELRCPRGITPLGSGIGIHGVKQRWAWLAALWQELSRIGGLHRYLGFTNGCILVANDDLDRMWPYIEQAETVVHIHGRGVFRPSTPTGAGLRTASR